MHTVRAAQSRIRVARTTLVRLDPHLSQRTTWTLYGHAPGKRGDRSRYGRTGTGR